MPEYAVVAVTFFPKSSSTRKQEHTLRVLFLTRALKLCIATVLLLLFATDAMAARRGVRIDFGAWGPAYGPVGNLDCPNSAGGLATWVNMIMAPGYAYSFWTNSGANFPVVDSYCQYATPYSPGLEPSEYLNNTTIPADEPGLAQLIGDNKCGGVTAERYTFLNASRFTAGVKGAQWAFYFFPGGQTIVALYSQLEIDELGFSPQIIQLWDAYPSLWQGTAANPDGYFYFQGADFIGPWDGTWPVTEGGPQPADSCPDLILQDGFE